VLHRLRLLLFDRKTAQSADRLILNHASGALDMARHAVRAAGETQRSGSWTRVLAEVELRTRYRPF